MRPVFLLLLLTAAGLSAARALEPLAVGARVPHITAPDQNGDPLDFAAVTAHGSTLIYFYPKAGTPGCTDQACSLRDADAALRARGITVIGVSIDPIRVQHDFHARNGLPFRLIADPERVVAASFGVAPLPNGADKREAFLIRDGVVVWRQTEATTKTAGEDVTAAFDALAPAAAFPPSG